MPALKENNGTVNVTYTYTCSGEGNDNCKVPKVNQKEQTIDGKQVTTTISSKVVDSTAAGS
ncbi:hypothetical protein HpBGD84_16860 [Helicobacter pylori]